MKALVTLSSCSAFIVQGAAGCIRKHPANRPLNPAKTGTIPVSTWHTPAGPLGLRVPSLKKIENHIHALALYTFQLL